jgi:pyruvyl transferase EpsO
LLTPGDPVALLDFPNHMNVGDSAIWLGERALLRDLGVPVAYACDQRGYVARHLRRALPAGGTILLHGGGNFGDLYPRHQRLRERVVEDFPEHRVVQLPQSVRFMDERALARASARFRRHERFTLLVRDEPSLERYGPLLGDDARLCPDAAFCLGHLAAGPGAGIVWLARADEEALASPLAAAPPDVRRSDWPTLPTAWRLRRILSRVVSYATSRAPRPGRLLWRANAALFDGLARERVRAGLALLGSARVVVTDRLHGHILTLLCDLPGVLLDSRTGKVRAFYEAWTRSSPLVRWADSPEAALAAARALAGP